MNCKTLEKKFSQETYLEKTDNKSMSIPEYNLWSLIRRLWKHIRIRRRVQFCLLFILMILASFAEVISIGAIIPFLSVLTSPEAVFIHPYSQPLIQSLNLNEPIELLLPLTVIFCLGAFVSGLTRLLLLYTLTRLSHSVGHDLSISIYYRTLYQPYSVHVSRNSSEVIAGIAAKANSVVYSAIMPSLNIMSATLIISFILIALLAVDPIIASVSFLGFGSIYLLVIVSTKKILFTNSQITNTKINAVYKSLQEGLGGIRDVLIDGTQEEYYSIYKRADYPYRRSQANIAIITSSPRFGIESLGMILIAILAFTLSTTSEGITNAIPFLGALALGAQRLLPMLQLFYASLAAFKGGQASLSDAVDLLDQPLPSYAGKKLPTPLTFEKNISLNNISFRYSEDTPWVIKEGFKLNIYKGSRIGLIGTTGSGKSTLLDIIMGLLQPTYNHLEVDGIKINDENHRAWLAHIAHVPQEIFLSDSTIAENIAFGIPKNQIDHELIHATAKKAQLAETIESWNDKYQTRVGERGVRLSGGQRQRIGIARALYKRADVIVLDEATSALDNETERAVMDTLESLDDKLTLIIVAHRLTTLKKCTQIIELEDGMVKRIGSYADIINDKKT